MSATLDLVWTALHDEAANLIEVFTEDGQFTPPEQADAEQALERCTTIRQLADFCVNRLEQERDTVEQLIGRVVLRGAQYGAPMLST